MIRGFREAVTDCGLEDIPLKGHQFTWERHRGRQNSVEEQLDRAMVSFVWKTSFRNALLTNLIASHSDHSPIVLDTEPREIKRLSW